MARPKFVQARVTTLEIGISATETGEILLKNLVDKAGNALAFSDFVDAIWLTINPGGDNEEIISATNFTVNSNGSVAIDTGIIRGLSGTSPYTADGSASEHAAGTPVVVSNNPQMYEAILDYIDSVAVAGGADASETGKGFVEMATVAQIDADEDNGETGAPVTMTPANLAASKYGLRLPTAVGKAFIDTVTGMLIPFAGSSAPTGFLSCDGTAYANNTYDDLALVLLGKFGYGTATTFTADNTNETFTAVGHGLSDGDMLFLSAVTSLPTGLSVNTPYYVINKTTNTFQLATSVGGAVINITSNGSGTLSYYTTFKVPDLRGTTPIGQGTKTITFTFLDAGVNTGTDVITVDSNDVLYDGQAVALTTSGVLPTGLSATTYYVIRVSATTIKLATSRANADDGTAVDITAAAGGGTHTLTMTLTARTFASFGGEENHAIQTEEMASHSHRISESAGGAGSNNGVARDSGGSGTPVYTNGTSDGGVNYIETIGGDTPHNNMMPYLVVNWVIKT